MAMTTDEIREHYLSFFEERGHKRLPSFPLVPPASDTSTLLIIAGMQPLKPYFLGREQPPHNRLTTARRSSARPTSRRSARPTRHLTFFEMMGNFSIGDYFKQGAASSPGSCRSRASGSNPTTSGSRSSRATTELGIGLDEEAIEAWLDDRRPARADRAAATARRTSGSPARPARAGRAASSTSTAGSTFGKADDLPGGDNERFMEYWNLVFMQYDQDPRNTLTPLPGQEHRHRPRPRAARVAAAGRAERVRDRRSSARWSSSGRSSAAALRRDFETDRALRILADHTRGMSFLLADGVVPSNEGRGYLLRRIMRRAIVQGRRLGIEGQILAPFADRVRELMGGAYPELHEQAETIEMWLGARGGAVRAHARAGHAAARRASSRAPRTAGGRASAPRRRSSCTTRYGFPFELTARAGGRAGHGRRRGGLRARDGARAPCARAAAGARRRRRRPRGDRGVRRGGRLPDRVHRLRDDRAGDRGRRDRASRTARCSPSSSSRRSTPPAAARSPTSARSSARRAAARRA